MRRSRFDASRPPIPPAGSAIPSASAILGFCPLVPLAALNRAYVRELTRQREARQPRPTGQLPLQFDSLLLPGTVLHNQRLVTANVPLFHDLQQPHAELIGYNTDMRRFRNQPAQLAHLIWQQFNESKKGHKEIQQDHQYAYVSISCSDEYFVVRLDRKPTIPTPAETTGYTQWRAHTPRACVPGSQPLSTNTP